MDLAVDLARRAEATNSHDSRPPIYKTIGIILAVSSGLFIGTSFVLKKKGLLKANLKYNEEAGEGYGYLKNAWWWTGMTLMILGELCNFAAYAFVDALLVTPFGALSVVITAILSAIFLKERLSFVGQVGCFLCIVGSVMIALNAPEQSSVATIQDMQHYVVSPGFLTYGGIIIVGCVVIALWAGPRYGKKSMLVYLTVCSLIGGLSVVATQGLGAAIVAQIGGTPQFNQWFLYVLLVFVIATLVTEIIYLNKALNIFNAALVTPTYYVYFTSATIVSSAILFRGFKGTGIQIATIIMAFLQICAGVVLLQLSKSAKDVPDSAVFKGDLDQVRTVAEQEEHESEPKADTIRGAASIIRTFSKGRLRMEAEEAKRIHEERLEPLAENEVAEWDGLRRRKTVLEAGSTPQRARTQHFPLGLTHFPSDSEDEDKELPADHHPHAGLFSNARRRAATVLSRRSRADSNARTVSFKSTGSGAHTPPTQLGEMTAARFPSAASRKTSGGDTVAYLADDDMGVPTGRGYGLPLDDDTHYKGASSHVAWTDGPLTQSRTNSLVVPGSSDGAPAVPLHGDKAAKRQFSFQNVFKRERGSSATSPTTRPAATEEERPGTGKSSLFGRRSGVGTRASATEEERLGLVQGDTKRGPGSAGLRMSPREGPVHETDETGEEYTDDGGTVRRSRLEPKRDADDAWNDRYEDTSDSDAYLPPKPPPLDPKNRKGGSGGKGGSFI